MYISDQLIYIWAEKKREAYLDNYNKKKPITLSNINIHYTVYIKYCICAINLALVQRRCLYCLYCFLIKKSQSKNA